MMEKRNAALLFALRTRLEIRRRRNLFIQFHPRLARLKTARRRKSFYVRPINRTRNVVGEYARRFEQFRTDEQVHQEYYRMSKETFDKLLGLVKPSITHRNTHELPISAAERLMITPRYTQHNTYLNTSTIICNYLRM